MEDKPKTKQYNQNILSLCGKVHQKYNKINKRLSDVELYYLIEYFLERDKYNDKQHKRTDEQTVDKIIDYAKHECVDVDDVKIADEYIELTNIDNIKTTHKDTILDPNTVHKNCYPVQKSDIFKSTKKPNKKNVVAISKNQDHFTYTLQQHAIKHLLSLFTRNVKYYNKNIMQYIPESDYEFLNKEYKTKEEVEECKKILYKTQRDEAKIKTNEYFYLLDDHSKNFSTLYTTKDNKTLLGLNKNNIIDKNNKIISIDFEEIDKQIEQPLPQDIEKKYLDEIYKFLSIQPELITNLIIQQLSKQKNTDINCILTKKNQNLMHSTLILAQTNDPKEHYKQLILINILQTYTKFFYHCAQQNQNHPKSEVKKLVAFCEKQYQKYEQFIKKIDKKSFDEIKAEIDSENEKITKKILEEQQRQQKNKKIYDKSQVWLNFENERKNRCKKLKETREKFTKEARAGLKNCRKTKEIQK